MIYGVYAVKDVKTGYMTPTIDISDEAAERNFGHAIVTTKGLWFTHPADFELYKLGTYNTENGVIDPCGPDLVVSAVDLKENLNGEV